MKKIGNFKNANNYHDNWVNLNAVMDQQKYGRAEDLAKHWQKTI